MRQHPQLEGKDAERAKWLAGALHRRFQAKVNKAYYRELARSVGPGVSLKDQDPVFASEVKRRRKSLRRVSLIFGVLAVASLGVYLATGGTDTLSGIYALCIALILISFYFELPAYSALIHPPGVIKALEPKLKLSPVERDYLNAMIRLSEREGSETHPSLELVGQLNRAINDYYGIKPGQNRPLSPTAQTAVTLVHEQIKEVLDQLAESGAGRPISELPEVSRLMSDVSTLDEQNAALEQEIADEFGSDGGLHAPR